MKGETPVNNDSLQTQQKAHKINSQYLAICKSRRQFIMLLLPH